MMSARIPQKMAVLMGGPGSERDVSLATGRGVAKALRSLGVEVAEVDVKDENFEMPADTELAFIALHGTFGEDGQVQRILESRGVPYTGEGVSESELAFDKVRTKQKFREHNVETPEWEVIRVFKHPTMPLPFVVKPPREGSTVGIQIVKQAEDVERSILEASKYDDELLIEKFIAGRELTIGVLGEQALPIIEIIPKGGFYDFTNKYPFLNPSAGGAAQHVCPAQLPDEQTSAIQQLALRAHRALNLQVYSRVDVILPEEGPPTVLELNTIPGMTETSLLPEAAGVAGIAYSSLCARIIELSMARKKGGMR